jgi:hypothetical protein
LYPHDHNFAFLTGGYHGPGYTTILFEYDEAQVVGLPGEPVAIRPCGRAALPRGAMMLYEPSRDIHYQEHPAELSISINVVVPGQYQEHDQFLFDIERQRIDVAQRSARARTRVKGTDRLILRQRAVVGCAPYGAIERPQG